MKDFIVFGVGQLGQLFAAGALRENRRVTPITRNTILKEVWKTTSEDTPILIGVGESELENVLFKIPKHRRQQVILVQNELFPSQWEKAEISNPTLAIIWLSKKKGRPVEIARPSTLFGPNAAFFAKLHTALDLPYEKVQETDLHRLLVSKFAFILGINTLGLIENLPLGAWLKKDEAQVDAILKDAVELGKLHLGADVDEKKAVAEAKEAMKALAHYPAKGRTAAVRLQRALADAEHFQCNLKAFFRVSEKITTKNS